MASVALAVVVLEMDQVDKYFVFVDIKMDLVVGNLDEVVLLYYY